MLSVDFSTLVLPNPEIIIATAEKLLKAFENACPPLEGYSNGIDKSKVGGIKKLQVQPVFA